MSVRHNYDSSLYNWKIENYEENEKYCWYIEVIPKKHIKTCYSIQAVPKVYEKISQKNSILILMDIQKRKTLRYSVQHAPSTHIEEV